MTATELLAEARRRADADVGSLIARVVQGVPRYTCGYRRTKAKACACDDATLCKRCNALRYKTPCGACLSCKRS